MQTTAAYKILNHKPQNMSVTMLERTADSVRMFRSVFMYLCTSACPTVSNIQSVVKVHILASQLCYCFLLFPYTSAVFQFLYTSSSSLHTKPHPNFNNAALNRLKSLVHHKLKNYSTAEKKLICLYG